MADDATTARAHRLMKLFESLRHQRPGPGFAKLTELNLSFSHMRVLMVLATRGTLPMKELAHELALTPPSLTSLVRRLVEVGLVVRQQHPEDSRVVLLSLTPEGGQLFKLLADERISRFSEMLRGLSDEDQELFLSLLERMIRGEG
jgi:DNA-binding MarR family transcriptional regulator